LRLIVAAGALIFAAVIVGRSFVDHVLEIRNSPAALVLLVVLIQLGWFISHAPAGGVVSSLKIIIGGCALVGALLAPTRRLADWSGGDSRLDLQRVAAALAAVWVVVDGVIERRTNLRRAPGSRDLRARPVDHR